MMSMRGLILASCCVLGSVLADAPSSGYSAPATSGQGYAAPAAGYQSPQASYNEPTGYASPATGYDAQSYDYSNSYAPSYEEEADTGLGFDLSKFAILIPVFIAVLLAIIIAALIGPFIAQLGVIAVGILPGALNLKAPIINAILAPFSLTLCTPGNPPTLFPAAGRAFTELAESYGVDPSQAEYIEDAATYAVNLVKDYFQS